MRLTKVRDILTEHGLDAILISQPENRRYLSGFTGSSGVLLISAERAVLATDFRYYEQVARESPAFELAKVTGKFSDAFKELIPDAGVHRLGFESQHVTVDQLQEWSAATSDVEWFPFKEAIETLRAVKDADEIEALRRSAAVTDAAFAHLVDVIKPGMLEREAAWEVEAFMREHGASKVAFDLIVASGPNGALPHARPGDRAIQAGDPIVVDIGCVVDGYCSDLTRTFCLGQAAPKVLQVWNTVLQAQQAAEAAISAGMEGTAAHAVAHDLITDAGYGDFFGHGLGHGVGLAVHERPWASRLRKDTLQAGMSLTVEPGIYLPNEFGVRLEDLVIVGQDGVEILSSAPKVPVV